MTMRYLSKLFVLVSFSIIASCRKDVDIPFDKLRNDLTILFYGSTSERADALQYIRISRTGANGYHLVSDAKVELTVDGVSVPVASPTPQEMEGVYRVKYQFSPRQKVAIRVSQGGSVATAEAIVPTKPKLLDMQLEDYERKYSDGQTYREARLSVSLQDLPNESNYYRIVLKEQPIFENTATGAEETLKDYPPRLVYIDGSNDLVLSHGKPRSEHIDVNLDEMLGQMARNTYLVFSDELFENKDVKLQPKISSSLPLARVYNHSSRVASEGDRNAPKIRYKHHRYTLELHAISYDMYKYLLSLNKFQGLDEDSPLTSPIQLFSNVSGGTGIFGVSSVMTVATTKVYSPDILY